MRTEWFVAVGMVLVIVASVRSGSVVLAVLAALVFLVAVWSGFRASRREAAPTLPHRPS